jgi:hypothetical protein
MITIDIIHIILILFNILFFVFGYILGRLNNTNGVYDNSQNQSQSFFAKNKSQEQDKNSKKIDIDSTKVVIDIKTDNLQKRYDNLGETKQSSEQISSAINKLKNMRG